ncbi:LamG-like jellyroll fold domain-containing protein [Sphingobacterium psychroaquaticum]|uniref:Uncharacterized protein n=1 Tax=Sphingobacterium psychroaquaticum TaxID=561061 RepID=A0A1X7LCE8_9SPHI|nr:LamG-like jellyroll fold domain-containing protein [Sphingobacterium psychroaquaticum]SMG51063.1 protein of unknown function [Sphingobacterium psychroaquaticum]
MKTILNFTGFCRLMLLCGTLLQFSCNEDFPNILKEEYNNKEMGSSLNKVLVVVVDGIRGNAMTDIDPENMRKIARNSFYSNSSLGDFRQQIPFTKETGLANIFTGVTSVKHQVTTDLSALNTETYPTLFERLKNGYSGFHGKGYTTNAQVNTHLFKDLDEKEVVSTDEEVLAKTKQAISSGDTEMVVAHLSNIEKVGKSNSFESNDPAYKQAIMTFDAQMLDLITTLEKRPNYKTENWLVVITSSVGGPIAYVDPTDQTVYTDNVRNTFTYFYSPRFTRKYQPRPSTNTLPFVGSGLHLAYGSSGVNATSAQLSDVNKMNFAANQDFTITFFFKQNTLNTDHNYPPILMKRNNTDDGTGWQFIMAGGNIQFGASGINKINTAPVKDAKWHAITVSVNRTANTARLYTDGVLSNQTTAGTTNITNTLPMVWGKKAGNTSNTGDFVVCNLQVYNVAMTDAQVKSYAGIGLVKPDNSPLYNNLLGYWPAYQDNGTRVLRDVTGKAGNMAVVNELKWMSFDEFVPYFRPDINESTFRLVPNQVDIPFFIYQWYGVLPNAKWNLDGMAWTPPYAVLEF